MISYSTLLVIPVDNGDACIPFFTRTGLHVATGYQRVVIGKRGPYVEFTNKNIIHSSIYVPFECKYRLNNPKVYYDEWRTSDDAYVKLYKQKQTVAYADYKVGLWYISPSSLRLKDGSRVLRMPDEVPDETPDEAKEQTNNSEEYTETLF